MLNNLAIVLQNYIRIFLKIDKVANGRIFIKSQFPTLRSRNGKLMTGYLC